MSRSSAVMRALVAGFTGTFALIFIGAGAAPPHDPRDRSFHQSQPPPLIW
jgi:hypothetical protein